MPMWSTRSMAMVCAIVTSVPRWIYLGRLPATRRYGVSVLGALLSLCWSGFLQQRGELRLKPALGDQCRHDRAEDHGGHQDRVLLLVDDVVGQAEQCRDAAESQPGAHQQRGVHPLARIEPKSLRQRQDADEFR